MIPAVTRREIALERPLEVVGIFRYTVPAGLTTMRAARPTCGRLRSFWRSLVRLAAIAAATGAASGPAAVAAFCAISARLSDLLCLGSGRTLPLGPMRSRNARASLGSVITRRELTGPRLPGRR